MKKVIIKDSKRIPQIGRGPILKPIYIEDDHYNLLKLLGFNVIEVDEPKEINLPKFETEEVINNDPEEAITDEKSEEIAEEEDLITDNTETVEEEETLEENNEEVESEEDSEEENIEEVESEEDSEEEENIEEVDIDSLTKKELKEILAENNISYNEKDNLSTLKKKVKELYM